MHMSSRYSDMGKVDGHAWLKWPIKDAIFVMLMGRVEQFKAKPVNFSQISMIGYVCELL